MTVAPECATRGSPVFRRTRQTVGMTIIKINAITARAGRIRVEVCDFKAQPVPGHTIADAKAIIGDQYQTKLQWGDSSDIGVPDGKPVILHFVMDRAKIYGLDFE